MEPASTVADLPATEPTSDVSFAETAPEESGLQGGVADALSDLFGSAEDLPDEVEPASAVADLPATEPTSDVTFAETAPEESGLQGGVADALSDLFGSAEDLPAELEPASAVADLPAEGSSRGATTMEELLGGTSNVDDSANEFPPLQLESFSSSLFDSADDEEAMRESASPSVPESPFADLLAGHDAEPHDEGASLGGDLAASLINDPVMPLAETPRIVKPVSADPADESFSGGMSNALSDLFGAELDEDLSDLFASGSSSSASADSSDLPTAAVTQTLGELYLSQGHGFEALQVFKDLDLREPGNPQVVEKIAEIQARINAGEFGPA